MIREQKISCQSGLSERRSILITQKFHPPEPLWKRAPVRDAQGNPYADFMMLISGLKNLRALYIEEIIRKLESIFAMYEEDIIFVDLNFKLNILWVTVQPRIGLTSEIAAIIHHLVPQAKLISQHAVSS